MKKLTIFSIFIFLVSTVVISAMTMPHPIFGKITNEGLPVSNLEIEVKNLNTLASMRTFTNTNGFYQADLGNFDDRYVDGQTVKVSLVYCASFDNCNKETVISGGGNEVSFDVKEMPEQPPVYFICSDGTKVEKESDCPVIDEPEYYYVCADHTYVLRPEDCSESSNSWVYWVIGILAVLLGGAGGWKFYNGKLKHYHKGVSGYHDPNTKHTNLKYRHTIWKESALKCISDVNKIQKGIDLSK